MKKLAVAGLVLAASLAAPAYAQMTGYVDIGAGQGKPKSDSDTDVSTSRQTVWAARVGARFTPNFALEAGYEDLGKYDFLVGGGSVKVSSWGVALVAIAPIEQFDIYGRLGYARTHQSADTQGFSATDNQNEAYYGVGGRYNWQNFGFFAEWNRHDKIKIDYWVAGVQLRF